MVETPVPRPPDAPPRRASDQVTLPSAGTAGYEVRDIRLRPILYAALGLFIAAGATQVLMWLLFELFAAREISQKSSGRPLAAELRRTQPPEPRLQHAPLEDLAALHAWEGRLLTTYALLDRETGAVRIPIERAIELIAERGLPARKAPAAVAPKAREDAPKAREDAPPAAEDAR
jgi:hypothetical protein